MAITYHPRGDSVINVRLEGRFVGTIRRMIGAMGGWHYCPRGARHLAGETFPTLEAVKQSLETA
jgi:hypothetical protein